MSEYIDGNGGKTKNQKKERDYNLQNVSTIESTFRPIVCKKKKIVTDKRPSKLLRTSSADTEGDVIYTSDELKLVHQRLSEFKTSLVKNDDIKSIVTAFVSEIKWELKNEIIKEVKERLTNELTLRAR